MVVDIRTWVKNVVNQSPTVTSNDIIVPLSTPTMCAKAVLICRPNSHPFQERTLSLDQPVKVGRSVARARASPTNAIFDCKVLSRHHALLWYKDGKFYLQDTKSSNGTFVNNNRLSPGGSESVAHEVCSGDIVQFGVDVVENNRKVTHGCIVATLKLYLHDGKEAKASHSLSVGANAGTVPFDELYELNQYIQEALQREQKLEAKLAALQQIVKQTKESSDLSWQAFIDQDRLLTRIDVLESKLVVYSKNYPEDKMREELLRMHDEKNEYQNITKENIKNLHEEKLDALSKVNDLQQSLSTAEDEVSTYKKMYTKAKEDVKDLAQRLSTKEEYEAELTSQLAAAEQREVDAEVKTQELLDKVDTQHLKIQEMLKQVEKLQQDKYILRALITELDKCTLNNCPVEIKFKVDNIIKEGLLEDSSIRDKEIDNNFISEENHKENNVTPENIKTDNTKYQEIRENPNEILKNLQEDMKIDELDNKSCEMDIKDKICEQISNWQTHFEEKPLKIERSDDTLKNIPAESILLIEKDTSILGTLKNDLSAALNEIVEKTAKITRMSDEIENLLESSALLNAKVNHLENCLSDEHQKNVIYKKQVEDLNEELLTSRLIIEQQKRSEQDYKSLINKLKLDMNERPTIADHEKLKNICYELETKINDINNKNDKIDKSKNSLCILHDDDDLKAKFIELEEELVVVKEQYAKSIEDKLSLITDMDKLHKDYSHLLDRSNNMMFFYIAPLVFLIVYLMFTTLFS